MLLLQIHILRHVVYMNRSKNRECDIKENKKIPETT